MYNILLRLPLFQGLSVAEFTSIIEKVKLHFTKYRSKEEFVSAGDPCDKLIFLLGGEIEIITGGYNNAFSISEYVNAPFVLEPHSLFGYNVHFASSYKGVHDTQIVSMDKSYILPQLDQYEVFRLNMMILLSNRAQSLNDRIWDRMACAIEKNIISFLAQRMYTLDGRKSVHAKMDSFADLLGETRLNLSRALNKWEKEGLVELHRQSFEILDFAKLMNYVKNYSSL